MAGCLVKDGKVADSQKLSGSTKIQCQDHIPKSHTLDDHLVPTGSLNMGSYRLKDLANPTDAQDIATKVYVDDIELPDPADRPMIAWPTSFSKCNAAALKVYTDLGINALMIYDHWWDAGFRDNTSYVTWLGQRYDNAAAAGVKIYVQIDNRAGEVSADDGKPYIYKFKGKSACAGWFIADEPNCWHDWGGETIPSGERWKYPYMTNFTWPAGGHGLAVMQYDKIRGQDNDPTNHPAFSVWDKGFMHQCSPPDWDNTYNSIYTPGGEIEDVGSVDIYPGGDNWGFLDHWINYSYNFPNGDGFGQLGEGMIPVIDAWTDGAQAADNLVNQCLRWEAKYGLSMIKGIGFYTPATWLLSGAKGENLREQIKDVCRHYGWGG